MATGNGGGIRIPEGWVPWLWSVAVALFSAATVAGAFRYQVRDEILKQSRLEQREMLSRYLSKEEYLEIRQQQTQQYYELVNAIDRLREQIRNTPRREIPP